MEELVTWAGWGGSTGLQSQAEEWGFIPRAKQVCEQGRGTVSKDSSGVSLGSGGGKPFEEPGVPEGEGELSQT